MVDGIVTTKVMLVGKSKEWTSPLKDDGSFTSSMTVGAPWGGTAIVDVEGIFPVFTVNFSSNYKSEPKRTITVEKQ